MRCGRDWSSDVCSSDLTLTYPHIGNTGTTAEDAECDKIWATGLVIRDLPLLASNFRSEQNLADYLVEKKVLGIADIDTRRLTRLLRDKGSQNGCILAGPAVLTEADEAKALAAAKGFAGLKGMDLAKVVSTTESYIWTEGTWTLGQGHSEQKEKRFNVVAYDFGVKRNILRILAELGCELTVVPAQTPASEVLALKPDGVFLANGPGDPEPCDYAIAAIRELIASRLPIFGICLGHQLLAL